MRYQVHLVPESEGGYTAYVPSLPGCITWGRNVRHALRMAEDAAEGYVASLVKHGEPVPDDSESLTAMVEVAVSAENSRA